jgi:hypothetical protein
MDPKTMSKGEIVEYQRKLMLAGFYEGELDGLWGPMTQRAHLCYNAPKAEKPDEGADLAVSRITAGIIAAASKYVNLTEISPNSQWDNLATKGIDSVAEQLKKELLATGWQLGWPYCAAFAEACWRQGYENRPELPLIAKNITPSAMGTWENFQVLKKTSFTPRPGALMIWQMGSTWKGHAAIVVDVDMSKNRVTTIEGNTSPSPGTVSSDREGDGVYKKTRALDFTAKSNGLNLKGFINPFII